MATIILSDDMQNRRIMNGIAASVGLSIKPQVTSNSYLAVCAHILNGLWCSIVPHTFFYVFGQGSDLAAIELTSPHQTQAIGLVISDRSPQSPMTKALIRCLSGADFNQEFGRRTLSVINAFETELV
ncbi:MAG: LysR family transcriptional regulator substrate-binding protein [Rhizobium sp.]